MPIPTVIDTDPGTDDALALFMALRSPALSVEGVTTVGGNASLRHTTANAVRLVNAFGVPAMPVAAGAARPLRGRFSYAYHFHGHNGLTISLPPSRRPICSLTASEFLVSKGYSFAGHLLIVALGPLTNLARALRAEKRFKEMVNKLVIMGGALDGQGNTTPYAEFNIYNDPEAAAAVLASGIPTTLVGLEVCRLVYLTRQDLPRFQDGDASARLLGRMLEEWFRLHPERERYELCDPLALAVALEPGIATLEGRTVQVITDDGPQRGRTVVHGPGPVQVVTRVDIPAFFHLFWQLMGIPT
ncbi:MAG: nucleoside hydrolase [Dehalococcoidia bacterium]|nr:nucleoside hydrolase [Dehalococcoidia bacterium]MDW8119200.1 nucleoside hydrolase [Chloroflexota bacterium]